jgi:HEAT repeat protein
MVDARWPGPRRSIERLASELGERAVVDACLELLAGRDVTPTIVVALGGPPARWALDGSPSGPGYWLRVWALRGLLWSWDARATSAVISSLSDESWRVREMAAKVIARHGVDDALEALDGPTRDPNKRVREAAERARRALTSADD